MCGGGIECECVRSSLKGSLDQLLGVWVGRVEGDNLRGDGGVGMAKCGVVFGGIFIRMEG